MAKQFLDTNMLLRHFLQDHPDQSPRATAYLARVENRELQVCTSDIVIFEAPSPYSGSIASLRMQFATPFYRSSTCLASCFRTNVASAASSTSTSASTCPSPTPTTSFSWISSRSTKSPASTGALIKCRGSRASSPDHQARWGLVSGNMARRSLSVIAGPGRGW